MIFNSSIYSRTPIIRPAWGT